MKILIDTNIIIHLEDHKVIETDYGQLMQLTTVNNCALYYHKICEKDIEKDKDEKRRSITLSKLRKYQSMPNTGIPTKEFNALVGVKNDNDAIDVTQLYQAHLGYVDLFITEDKGIQRKAEKLALDNVVSINKAIEKLKEIYTFKIPQHPILEHVSLRSIINSLSSSFFNSLRKDYHGFDGWFKKSAEADRMCYVFKSDENIAGLLIYKEEAAKDHKLPNIHEDALKMATFKVAETAFGNKLGELFLSRMFAFCIEKKIPYLYLTIYEKQIELIQLLEGFGFEKLEITNKNGNIELAYCKSMLNENVSSGVYENLKQIHPFYYDNDAIEKYVIPIQEHYYNTLFKDGSLRQPDLFDRGEESFFREIQGNTIVKAYICNSNKTDLAPGSLLFFYASKIKKAIEPVGVLDSIQKVKTVDEVMNLVNKRTVYSADKIEEWLFEKKELTVVLFRVSHYLPKPIPFKEIKRLISFSNKFTTITTFKEEDYLHLKKLGYTDERYIIN